LHYFLDHHYYFEKWFYQYIKTINYLQFINVNYFLKNYKTHHIIAINLHIINYHKYPPILPLHLKTYMTTMFPLTITNIFYIYFLECNNYLLILKNLTYVYTVYYYYYKSCYNHVGLHFIIYYILHQIVN
jgi:hypothetical protein